MKGIILHGGYGTRLRPLTHTGPKQLLPIANKPMSQYCVESIRETGVTDIAIIIGGIGADKVREYYGTGEKFGVNITYIEQDSPRGIAHAIRLCKDFINNEKFLVFLGDNIIQRNITEFVRNFELSDAHASVLLCEVDNPSKFGIARFGNITESKGNVFEVWENQIKENKAISITDSSMNRYFFHIEEAVEFILNCLPLVDQGEIFIPKMKKFNIKELANKYSKKQLIIGLRKGEKIKEILMTKEEEKIAIQNKNMWIIKQQYTKK